ncbi:hypothetical protein [Spirosoma agri]|uniref:Uncharacterized protein n=1 Tax=Spirosoma agri TaxID=1987381 RepID=A0A6M0IJF3_9BACT|nr:hypothetical protein [Spirosoma agri]NEU67755.1 hypothetical protein [Spirosoma agri]
MKKLLGLLLLISSFVQTTATAQFTYRQSVVGTDTLVYRIDFEGKAVRVARLPADVTRSKKAIQRLNTYTTEAKATFNTAQFGTGKYFDPNYFFSIEFNGNLDNVPTRKAQGVSMFSSHVQPNQDEYNALPQNQKIYYGFEGSLHGQYEGAKYYESTIEQLEAQYNSSIPSGYFYAVPNIETSTEWNQWRYVQQTGHGYDSWQVAQNRSIKCESDGVTRTLGQLYSSGLWDIEMTVRRANRNAIMATIFRARNTYFAYGSSMKQGEPRIGDIGNKSVFIEGTPRLTFIGGNDATGTITLNGRTYTGINKNVYGYENSMLDYYYYFSSTLNSSDYQSIFIAKNPGTQTLPYIWSKQLPYHIVASEKGHWQANKWKMQNVPGQTDRGSVRMQEPFYEGNFYTTDGVEVGAFMPFAEVQGVPVDGFSYTPKVWLAPYLTYGAYVVHRFLEGSTPGSGYHLFNAPGQAKLPSSHGIYNHHLHTITAIFQARNDMQPLERFYAGSTLVQDPDVQLLETGSWLNYNGSDAFGFQADGGRLPQKPAYIVRYKPTSSGWQVYVEGGMNQDWTASRIDRIRLPGALNGNVMRVKLTGPSVHVYEFAISSGDTGQVYEATQTITTTVPGYGGRLNLN